MSLQISISWRSLLAIVVDMHCTSVLSSLSAIIVPVQRVSSDAHPIQIIPHSSMSGMLHKAGVTGQPSHGSQVNTQVLIQCASCLLCMTHIAGELGRSLAMCLGSNNKACGSTLVTLYASLMTEISVIAVLRISVSSTWLCCCVTEAPTMHRERFSTVLPVFQ